MDIDSVSINPDQSLTDRDIVPMRLPPIADVLAYIYGGFEHMPAPTSFTSGSGGLQGCLPLLMQEMHASALSQRIGEKKYTRLHTLYQQSNLLNLWFSLELQQVLTAITEAHLPVMVLKGADLASTIYPRPELRHYGDVDLMVKPADLAAVIAILERLGYHYHQEYRFETISKQRAAFVYVREVSLGFLVFEIHISPHHNEFGIAFDTDSIWNRARPITVAGVAVQGMGLADLFLYLCWHYRSHAFYRLIWLYDIAVLLLRCSNQLDWPLIQRLAQQQGLKATAYYCLQWCQQVFAVPLPDALQLEQFKPPAFIEKLITRNIGHDLRALLPRKAERERKLLQRLMVDNSLTLLQVLARSILPTPTHLGRLYMEHSRLPLRLFWVFYFLHPFILLKTALQKRFHT